VSNLQKITDEIRRWEDELKGVGSAITANLMVERPNQSAVDNALKYYIRHRISPTLCELRQHDISVFSELAEVLRNVFSDPYITEDFCLDSAGRIATNTGKKVAPTGYVNVPINYKLVEFYRAFETAKATGQPEPRY